MDIGATNNIVIKKEPNDSTNGSSDDSSSQNPANALKNESTNASTPGPLKYVSRRGRPPGGGYSMKSHPHYVRFSSLPLTTSVDLGRQLSSGPSSSLASHDLLKTGGSSSTDNLDIRRFGFPGFDSDKNSFRCDGCDVVFSSRDTYAMHMLLRAKNESCVALPTSAISSNPENPTPREKFERELRQQTMIAALRNQATAMLSKTFAHSDSLASLVRSAGISRDDVGLTGSCGTDGAIGCNNLFSLDAYGLYVDSHQYRRTLEEYGLRTSASASSLEATTEQLSCRECGEIFTGKDALAMHMMFHTRDDEKDTSPSVSWADLRSISSQKHESPWSSASSSPTQCTGPNRTIKGEQSTETKRDTSKAEDGLTAERVVELKRMAIESSLRASLKPTGALRQSTRPKSVSQDAPVTTSAQNRPLSADDARRFTNSEPTTHQDLRAPTLFCKDSAEDQAEMKAGSKRRFATIEHGTSFDIKRLSVDAKKRKNGYENIFYNFFYRSSKRVHPSNNTQTEKDASVSDNHVSSASGPQDSDDRSEGSSATEQESSAEKDEQATNYSKMRTIPYLDAIMSQQAVLVPLDSASSKDSSNETVRGRKRSTEESHKTQSSAIDFSTRRRDNSRESIKQSSWYVPQSSRDNAEGVEIASHGAVTQMSATTAKTTRNDNHGNVFNQYQNFNCNTGTQVENQGQRLGKRQPAGSRLSTSTGSVHHENEPRSWTEESTNRVGEARYCPHCEILFLDVTLFHLHMGLHNVNNPWQCNTCGLVCTGRLDFNIHVLHY